MEGLDTITDSIISIADMLKARGLRRRDRIPSSGWTYNGDTGIRLAFLESPTATPPFVTWGLLINILTALKSFFTQRKGVDVYETNFDAEEYTPSGKFIGTLGRGEVMLQRQLST